MKSKLEIKRIFCAITIASLIFASACAGHSVNDTDTGEVELSERKAAYTDGDYMVYDSHYDEGGLASVLCARIYNGLIVEVNFDYVDFGLNRYSHNSDEESYAKVEQFKSEVKNLNTRVLTAQSASSLSVVNDTSRDYIRCFNAMLPLFSTGQTHNVSISTVATYTAFTDYNDSGYRYILNAGYNGDTLVSVNFSMRNASGRDISDNREFLQSFNAAAEAASTASYSELMRFFNATPTDGVLEKGEAPSGGNELLAVYNTLANRIIDQHRTCSGLWLL